MLSFGKILLVAAAVGALIVGTKLVRQMNRQNADPVETAPEADQVAADLTQCPKCGAYAARRCDKEGCPVS